MLVHKRNFTLLEPKSTKTLEFSRPKLKKKSEKLEKYEENMTDGLFEDAVLRDYEKIREFEESMGIVIL